VNILHVITDLRMGGAERALVRLALATREAGHHVEVVALKELGLAAEPLQGAGVACHALHASERPGLKLLSTTVELGAFIRSRKPDLIHAWLTSACAAVHLCAPPSIACIYGVRVTDVPPPAVTLLLRASRGARIRWVAVSQGAAQSWSRVLGLPSMDVIPNGMTFDAPPVDENPGARPVFLGRLSHQKGVDVLLRAMTGMSVGVDVYGSGDQDDELRTLAEMLDVDAHFHGVTRDPRRALDRASLLVLPSRAEGMPNVALEAMAAARAVVATRIPGTDEVVVDGGTGLLVPAGDAIALRDAVERLQGDAPLRKRLARAGHARVVKYFSHPAVVEQWLRLYERTV